MQKIIVSKNTLFYDDFKFKCSVGKNGFSLNKKEGDNKTPKGTFFLGPLYYRKDRVSKLITDIKKIKIESSMGWCDDSSNKNYNKLIRINKDTKTRHEKLFLKQNSYDLVVPVLYNTKKIKKKRGSAIFLHLTVNYKKTAGCIALNKKDMLILLKLINKKTKIKIA